MKKHFSVVFGAAALLWVLAMLFLVKGTGFTFVCALVCGILVYLIAMAGYLWAHKQQKDAEAELSNVTYVILLGYAAAGTVINARFCMMKWEEVGMLLLIANFVITIAAVVLVPASVNNAKKGQQLADEVRARTAPTALYSSTIASLIAAAKDDEVRKELKKLKETVDYGTNVSRVDPEEKEQAFTEKLMDIEAQLKDGAAADAVIENIREAIRLYQSRNASMQTL